MPDTLAATLRKLGVSWKLLDAARPDLAGRVSRANRIRNWILTGSAWDVDDPEAPQIPPGLLQLPGRRFLAICYAHESLLAGLGVPLYRGPRSKGNVRIRLLHPAADSALLGFADPGAPVRVSFDTFALAKDCPAGWKLLADRKGVLMAMEKGTVTSVQFHPEGSPDAMTMVGGWLAAGEGV